MDVVVGLFASAAAICDVLISVKRSRKICVSSAETKPELYFLYMFYMFLYTSIEDASKSLRSGDVQLIN